MVAPSHQERGKEEDMLLLLDLWRRCTALCFAIIIANDFNFLRRYQPQRKVQSEGSHHLPLRHVSSGIAPRQYGKVSETLLSGHLRQPEVLLCLLFAVIISMYVQRSELVKT